MKNLLARVLTPLFLLVLLSAGIASAQYVPVIMVVDIHCRKQNVRRWRIQNRSRRA